MASATDEVLLDTSAWVAWFRDEAAAERLAARVGDSPIVTSPLVLAELSSLEARGHIQGNPLGEIPKEVRVEPVTVEDARQGGRIHGGSRGRKGSPSIVDAILLATARRLEIPLVTTDRGLAGDPGVEVLR